MQEFPILPLRNIVVFPSMVVPLFIGRARSVNALEKVMADDGDILLVTQRKEEKDDPKGEDLYDVGIVANIMQVLRLPDGTVKVLAEGSKRVNITQYQDKEDYLVASIDSATEIIKDEAECEALHRALHEQFEEYAKMDKKISQETVLAVQKIKDSSKLADLIAQNLSISLNDKQELLECLCVDERMEKLLCHMESEFSIAEVEKRVRSRVKRQMEKTQREYYLNEQMKAIQKELGDTNHEQRSELEELKEKIESLKLSKEAAEKAKAELKKLSHMSPMSSEATVVRNYLDWIVSLPWSVRSKTKKDLGFAEKTLNKDHYGLDKVKERIIEYLAVLQRVRKLKGPILCLVGPPGVGKTSLGRSIADATNRKFVRMSLGGVRDEAEIRGHRRTYIGSLPGRIIQGMKKAGKSNPLFLLDEIDKMAQDYRGDPSSALLEVLDPEQNSTFHDHYLELDYDLSDVMFIATANSLNIPEALRDRMEIIHLSGYTEEEKIEIAKQHLLEKVIKDNGLAKDELIIDVSAITSIIRYYTREAGVRSLERQLQKCARKAVRKILQGQATKIQLDSDNLEEFLGVKQYRFGVAEEEDLIGVVTGLAYTSVGGDILMIESILKRGTGKISKTGKLGTVMQESIEAAENYIKYRAADLGIPQKTLSKNDIHVHVPEGATPKDGPSAGIAMVTSLVSSLTGIPIRRNVAMTGEVTLRGRVLPIGGLKEKLLAALRGGITKVLIPKDNEKDLTELPEIIAKNLTIVPVTTVDEVLEHALTQELIPIIEDKAALDELDNELSKDVLHH